MKISKQKYLQGFAFVVVLLGMVRCIFPQVATDRSQGMAQLSSTHLSDSAQASQQTSRPNPSSPANMPTQRATASRFFHADGSEVKNRIYSVSNFSKAFPCLLYTSFFSFWVDEISFLVCELFSF